MNVKKENYKSDIELVVTLTLGGEPIPVPDHDFLLRFTTSGTFNTRHYDCSYINGVWTNCKKVDETVVCFLDNHKLRPGTLCCEFFDYSPDADFADGNQLKVVPSILDVELILGAGDDATSIDAETAADVIGVISQATAAAQSANIGADNANTAAEIASNAASVAIQSSTAAEHATQGATTAANSANSAASTATDATSLAQNAALAANQAAANANAKASVASQSAIVANTAADNANAAAATTAAAVDAANQAVEEVNDAVERVDEFIDSINIDDYYTKEQVDAQIASIVRRKSFFIVVASLPPTGNPDYIYLIYVGGGGNDVYDEYIWLPYQNRYEKIGSTRMDLSNYYTKSQTDDLLNGKLECRVVTSLPSLANAEHNVLYFVPNGAPSRYNLYDEYIVVESNGLVGWEQIGSSSVDLSDYYTKSEADNLLSGKEDAPFIVNGTYNQQTNSYTFDKTATECVNAYNDGKEVIALVSGISSGNTAIFRSFERNYLMAFTSFDTLILQCVTANAIITILCNKLANTYTVTKKSLLVDNALSATSTNAVQNNVVTQALNNKYTLPQGGIPSTDMSAAVQSSLGKADTALQGDFCPIIEDGRSIVAAAITGVAPFAMLVDGQRILLHLNKNASSGNHTLNLTLSDGTTETGAKSIKVRLNTSFAIIGSGYPCSTNDYLPLVYNADEDSWLMIGNEKDTTYAQMNQTRLDEGTATGAYTISPELLRTNFYLKSETTPKRTVQDDSAAVGTVTLNATKYHDLGTTDTVDVELPSGAARTDEFLFTFTCDTAACTLSLPTGVELGNGLTWEAAAGRKVQVSIMDGIALYAFVDSSNE